jgi:hypothetical protein
VQAVRWLKPPAIIPNPFGINRNLKVVLFFSDGSISSSEKINAIYYNELIRKS